MRVAAAASTPVSTVFSPAQGVAPLFVPTQPPVRVRTDCIQALAAYARRLPLVCRMDPLRVVPAAVCVVQGPAAIGTDIADVKTRYSPLALTALCAAGTGRPAALPGRARCRASATARSRRRRATGSGRVPGAHARFLRADRRRGLGAVRCVPFLVTPLAAQWRQRPLSRLCSLMLSMPRTHPRQHC